MVENELEATRKIVRVDRSKELELEKWFKEVYPYWRNRIEMYAYWGLKAEKTRYELEMEAYQKENELRQLRGLDKLPPLKIVDLL